MKQIAFLFDDSLRFFSLYFVFISEISSPDNDCTLQSMHAKTQGKRQLKIQQQAGGKNLELDYLHNYLRLE